MKYRRKPLVVDAIRFDPADEHKRILPDGVIGIPSPSADNWAYEGCLFWVAIDSGDPNSPQHPLKPGQWVITARDGSRMPMANHEFTNRFEQDSTDDKAASALLRALVRLTTTVKAGRGWSGPLDEAEAAIETARADGITCKEQPES